MDALWKWLMKANARGVFVGFLMALGVVTAWWTWKELAPQKKELRLPTSNTPANVDRRPLGVLAFVEAEAAQVLKAPYNPFLPPYGVVKGPENTTGTNTVTQPKNPNVRPGNPQTVTGPVQPQPPKPPRPPKRETVSLLYKGIFQRTDGRVLALVEDSKSKDSRFYAVSNELFGARIGSIGVTNLVIIDKDGLDVNLELGKPSVFAEGKSAN